MLKLTPQEELELKEALWKAADGINQVRIVLAGIGNRLSLRWHASPDYILDIVGFVADNRPPAGFVGKSFTDEKYWKKLD
jgi:hypothetical protein